MTTLNQLKAKFKNATSPRGEKLEFIAITGDHDGNMPADDFGNVYITHYNGHVQIVYNETVPLIPWRPVAVGYKNKDVKRLEVLRYVDAYPAERVINVPNHADKNHQWGGVDTLWVRKEQLLFGLAIPNGGMNLQFVGMEYYLGGFHVLPSKIYDLSSYVPANGAFYLLGQANAEKVISFVAGDSKASREVLELEDISAPSLGNKPLFAVKLYAGQTQIIKSKTDTDIIDLRFSGYASGGEAEIVAWDDVTDKPDVYPPDLTISDAIYPRKWYKSAAPTMDDDITTGFSKSDVWIDQSNGDAYICIDNADGAADWLLAGSGSGDYSFTIEGRLAVATNVPNAFIITKDVEINACYIYCKLPGITGSTIVDVNKNGVTIFTTQANRPTLAFDDADGWASSIPDILTFAEGDVITLDIDQIATGAADLVVALSAKGSGSGSGGLGLTVTDGSTTVSNVGKITVDGGKVIDSGGGQISIKNIRDYILVRDEKPTGISEPAGVTGVWLTRDINAEVTDDGGHCSIASNQITLGAGTYECSIEVPGWWIRHNKARLYNITDASVELYGSSTFNASGSPSLSKIKGKFTIASSKIFEVQHWIENANYADGFGVPAYDGSPEIYTIAEFWKVR